ncbi:MAG: type pantothenate kinase, partial [Proteobacteria bacterium]|nr:type pantothenate kinase [Pseudomonadota bacterium]
MNPETALLVDIGNSRVKWGLGQAGRVTSGEAFPSRSEGLRAEMERCWGGLPAPGAVVVASVAGRDAAEILRDWLFSRWGVVPRLVCAEPRAHGVVNGYDDPAALGVDRWVCLLGAHRLHTGPLCIADCGTALTLDALDGAGRHLGGLIGPGLQLMRRS